MNTPIRLDPHEPTRIYCTKVLPDVFAGSPPVAHPTLAFVDGQPDAGKSGIVRRVNDVRLLVREVGQLLHKTSLRIERIFVSVQALHPAFRARTYL